MLNKEVECLVDIGIIELSNESKCGEQNFLQNKPKGVMVNFLSCFRNLNSQLKYKIYSMTKIQ